MPPRPAIRSAIFENIGLLRRRMEGSSLPLLLLGAFVLLYLSLFRLPFIPIFTGGDENLYLPNATRMMDGEMIYRDFFEFVTPGLTVVNLGFFKLFGPRAWVPHVSLILLGLGLTWLIGAISRKVLSGGAAFLPAVLFLTYAFIFMLDDTHHWYSTLAELGAVRIVIEKRTPARLLGAGALCGLASFFMQTQGVFALVGLAIFLVWEGTKADQGWRKISRRAGYLFVSFVATVLATNAYFVWKVGLDRFLYCNVGFVFKYWTSDRASNSIYALLYEFTNVAHGHELPYLGVFLFIHALLPLVYVLFWIQYRREALAPEQGNRLMLLSIMGLLLFAGVAPTPTTFRLSTVTPLGLILLVWLIRGRKKLTPVLTLVLSVVAACVAVAFPLRIQTQRMGSLDLPRGRTAMDPAYYERLLWWSQQTHPGEFVFTAAGTDILFPLALRNPAEVRYVTTNNFTRPEQVRKDRKSVV